MGKVNIMIMVAKMLEIVDEEVTKSIVETYLVENYMKASLENVLEEQRTWKKHIVDDMTQIIRRCSYPDQEADDAHVVMMRSIVRMVIDKIILMY